MDTILSAWLAGLCLISCLAGLTAWRRPTHQAVQHLADGLGGLCLALSAVAWLLRWRSAGHLPLFGTYESSLSLTLAVLLGALAVRLRLGPGASIWPVAGAVAAGLLAHGLGYDTTLFALTISERSWVVDVHAVCAWAAFGALTANAGFAVHHLRRSSEGTQTDGHWLAFSLSLGFVLHSAMLASGSLYKFLLFGQAWTFDPIETLGFVAWVAYGTLLHMHLSAGWEGRRLAAWCLALFVLLVVSYRGIVYFPAWSTYHIFDMDLRIHLTGSPAEPGGGG
jgi:ABC-type transport system involved in cytochrome c biogenesis permease subunit